MSQTGASRLDLLLQALTARVELLERENRDLKDRVARLEAEGYVLVDGAQERSSTPPRSSGYGLPFSTPSPPPRKAPSAASVVGPASSTSTSSSSVPEQLRQQVADEIGEYFRRCLAGNNRGSSGREKVNLANRYYVIVRDAAGVVHDPVLVVSTWREAQTSVTIGPGPGKQFGDSIFVGFPSQWEAKRAVAKAGLRWPADGN